MPKRKGEKPHFSPANLSSAVSYMQSIYRIYRSHLLMPMQDTLVLRRRIEEVKMNERIRAWVHETTGWTGHDRTGQQLCGPNIFQPMSQHQAPRLEAVLQGSPSSPDRSSPLSTKHQQSVSSLPQECH